MCAIMPERLAATDPFKQVTEVVGSGPFRFKADERVPGSFVAYERFPGLRAPRKRHTARDLRTEDRPLRPDRVAYHAGRSHIPVFWNVRRA